MTRLEVGESAPKFTVETPRGTVSLDELIDRASKGVIVYFYPKAGTPGCTKEACDFRDNLAALRTDGYEVIGISPDSVEALERFASKNDLGFTLGSDSDHTVMNAWGTWGEKRNYGRVFEGVIRSTFVVGKDGKLALAQYNVKATGHVARLLRDIA